MKGNLKDKIGLSITLAFFLVGGFTFNFFGSMSGKWKTVFLGISVVLFIATICFVIIKKEEV